MSKITEVDFNIWFQQQNFQKRKMKQACLLVVQSLPAQELCGPHSSAGKATNYAKVL